MKPVATGTPQQHQQQRLASSRAPQRLSCLAEQLSSGPNGVPQPVSTAVARVAVRMARDEAISTRVQSMVQEECRELLQPAPAPRPLPAPLPATPQETAAPSEATLTPHVMVSAGGVPGASDGGEIASVSSWEMMQADDGSLEDEELIAWTEAFSYPFRPVFPDSFEDLVATPDPTSRNASGSTPQERSIGVSCSPHSIDARLGRHGAVGSVPSPVRHPSTTFSADGASCPSPVEEESLMDAGMEVVNRLSDLVASLWNSVLDMFWTDGPDGAHMSAEFGASENGASPATSTQLGPGRARRGADMHTFVMASAMLMNAAGVLLLMTKPTARAAASRVIRQVVTLIQQGYAGIAV